MDLSEKGKDVIATLEDGSTRTVFRCNCWNKKCREWRCSVTGAGIILDVVKWEYADDT